MIFIDNKYTRYYYDIITNAKSRKQFSLEIVEKHHIIPESFYINRNRSGHIGWLEGNPNESTNIVMLTPREHFICHLLLTKMTTGKAKAKMDCAAWRLVNSKGYCVTSRIYEKLRLERSITLKELTNGRSQSKESIAKGVATRYANGSYKHSSETKMNMSISRKGRPGWNKGLTKDTDSRLNGGPPKGTPSPKKGLPGANKGKTLTKHVCPHCNVSTSGGNLKRWHGNNCKASASK